MSYKKAIHKTLTYLISTVWLVNGLLCKVLNLVPRHEQIVSRILGDEYSGLLTKAIGICEVFMAIWILSAIKTRVNAVAQILIIAAMNVIEFIIVPHLLLFGKVNSVVALMFIFLIYYNEFVLNKELEQQT